jgi:L-rhamnose isomerase
VTDYFDTEKSFLLTVYTLDKSTGLTTTEQSEIRPTTEKFNEFVKWCKANDGDWESSPASFVGQFTMTQDDFGLLYINNGVVIHFLDKGGKPRQYTKTVKAGDFEFLLGE